MARARLDDRAGHRLDIGGKRAAGELVECTVRNNEACGVGVYDGAQVVLVGGTIKDNTEHGVFVSSYGGAKITVASAAGSGETISTGNGMHDWATYELQTGLCEAYGGRGVIEGLAEGMKVFPLAAGSL